MTNGRIKEWVIVCINASRLNLAWLFEVSVGYMIAVIDYGAGNLRSVQTAFERLCIPVKVTGDPQEILSAEGLILPGVGAFADAMKALKQAGLPSVIREYTASQKPLLGICLGMQLLLDQSEEGEGVPGLGLIPGYVARLPYATGLKVPHMGWNSVRALRPSALLEGLSKEAYMYFVHSYACEAACSDDVLAVTDYGRPFHSVIQRGNIMGVQFHPEKSGEEGQRLLRNFSAMAETGGVIHAG